MAAEVSPPQVTVGEMVEGISCARARLDRGEAAMEALAQALDLGFKRTDLLATDPDLDALRDRDDFKAMLASLTE